MDSSGDEVTIRKENDHRCDFTMAVTLDDDGPNIAKLTRITLIKHLNTKRKNALKRLTMKDNLPFTQSLTKLTKHSGSEAFLCLGKF